MDVRKRFRVIYFCEIFFEVLLSDVFYFLFFSKCDISSINILDLNCGSKSALKRKTHPKNGRKNGGHKKMLGSNALNGDLSYLKTESDGNGFTIKASEKFKNVLKMKEMLKAKKESENEQRTGSQLKGVSTFLLKKDYSNLGWSLETADLNNDNSDDLLMSAPVYTDTNSYQDGAVFAILSKNGDPLPAANLDLEKDASIIFKPPKNVKNSRFGHSVVVLDLNQDGFQDVVISAPSFGLKNKTYEVISTNFKHSIKNLILFLIKIKRVVFMSILVMIVLSSISQMWKSLVKR